LLVSLVRHARLLTALAVVPSPIVLNEVLYDPDGSDGGLEFVEIAARSGGDPQASLEGWTLETGNGTRPGEWAVAWTGRPGDRLRDGLFVVGESAVEPLPDVVTDLDLQNGPDACRLRGPAGEIDVLGWGAPLADALFEGTPAPDVSGLALARLPDGVDTDDNSRDFLAVEPTPGGFNAPDTALIVERFVGPPPDAPTGSEETFRWVVRNAGRSEAAVAVRALCAVHPDEVLADAHAPPIAPGERADLQAAAVPPAGIHRPRSDPPAPEDAAAWRGPGADLSLSEVMSRPEASGPEWIEVECVASRPVDLAAVTLTDAASTAGPLAGILQPGVFALIAPDTAAVLARWSPPASTLLVEARPWPALNHSASAGREAERVSMLVADVPMEEAALPGGAEEGVSWERVSRHLPAEDLATWAPSLDRSGATPGRANSGRGDRVLPAEAVGKVVALPSPFRPLHDGAVLIVVRPGRPTPSCRVDVYDAAGLRVAELSPWPVGPREHRALWDGRTSDGETAPIGLYVIRAEAPGERPVRRPLVLVR